MKTAKRALAVVLAVAVILSGWVWIAPEKSIAASDYESNYLFAYFTGTSIEGQTIHLAVSQDGLNYTALRNNEPVIVPSKGTGCVRDPYLWYNENDGYYYILATDLDFTDTGSDYSDNSESFIVWRSKNLVNWYDETMIDVKAILGRLGINNNNMQAVWAPQVLWDGSKFVVYFSLQCDGTSNGSWNPLTIVYLKTSNLLDESQYDEYGVIHNPGRHVIDADIIKNPNTNQYYMFYKDEAASGGVQSIYYMISDNGPTGPYYAPNNANDGRGPQLFSDIGKNLEGCNSFFDDNGNLVTYVDEYDYINAAGQKEAHFHVSSSSDFSTFTTLPDSSHNINTLSPRHGSVVKITDEEYNRLIEYSGEITSSSFPETENLKDHLVGRYFTTSDYTYNAANGGNDLTSTGDGTITATTDASGDYYAYFNAAGAEINLADLISGDLNIKDGFTITFSARASTSLGSNARFFDISNNWSQRADASECYLHMSPVAVNNGLYVGVFNGPVTTTSWPWISQGTNYNDGVMHDYIISFADGNMILYIDGELAMKRDRYNMNTEYGDNFLTDSWYKAIGNSKMRIGKSEWDDPLFTGEMQNLCIYDCSLSYYDVQKMQKIFDDEAGKTTIAKIAVPETVYMTPSTGASTTGQYYVNNTMHNGTNEVNLEVNPTQTSGIIEFYIPGAKQFIVELNTVTSGIGDVVLAETGATSGSYENTQFDADANGYFSYKSLGVYINGTGISAGNSALAEWKITVIMQDGSQTTHYAYTTLYAPWYQPVGAAARAKSSYRSTYASSIIWVSGVHGYSDGDRPNSYYVQTANFLPMLGIITTPTGNSPDGVWIQSGSNGLSPTMSYQSVDASGTKYHARSNSISPTANITIDTSRYSNLNQIPNLKVGFMITDQDNTTQDSCAWYFSDFTGQTSSYYNGTATGSSQYTGDYDSKGTVIKESSGRGIGAPVYNDTWNKGISDSTSLRLKGAVKSFYDAVIDTSAWNNVFVNINVTGVDKTNLRNLVLKSTFFNESDYTTASWSTFKTALQAAATALGNPTNSTVSTTALQNAIDALQTTVKLEPNGGNFNGSTSVKEYNVTIGDKSTLTYTPSDVPVRTGYEFKGWATSANAESGSKTVNVGFHSTLYAVWEEITYHIIYDNLIDFRRWDTSSASKATISNVANGGFTLTSNAGVNEGTSTSPTFAVTAGKQYKVDADITGDGWDVYIFFYDSEMYSGLGLDFGDTKNRYSSNGTGNQTQIFTAPTDSVKAVIRVDANGSDNAVTFSNIRVYEVGKGVDNVSYTESTDVHYNDTYGTHIEGNTLPTPTRPGFTFAGWVNSNSDSVSASTVLSTPADVYLTSTWNGIDYTLTFDTDGGTLSSTTLAYNSSDASVQLPVPTKDGYDFMGWKVTTAAGNWNTTETYQGTVSGMYGSATLTAQWKEYPEINVTFDNLIDISSLNYTSNNKVTISEITETGFTVTAIAEGNDNNTGLSQRIDVEPNTTYYLSVETDFVRGEGGTNGFEIFVNNLNGNGSAVTLDASQVVSGCKIESGSYFKTSGYASTTEICMVFTTSADTEYLRLRFDANDKDSVLKVNNIRLTEAGREDIELPYVNKYVKYKSAYGTLPAPTKTDGIFLGWYNGSTKVTSESVLDSESTVYLTSKWICADTAVLDFGIAVNINPLDNDDIKGNITGLSVDGNGTAATTLDGDYGTFTLSGNTVTYTPGEEEAIDGIEIVFCHIDVDGTVYTTKLTVAPASNVLYEDKHFTVAGNESGVEWSEVESSASGTAGTGDDSVYGFDSSYAVKNNYSAGTAKSVTVDSTNKRSQILATSFTGTGFTLYGACGPNAGVQLVTICGTDGVAIKAYIVDTYYSEELLYQVPVLTHTGLTYGTWTVKVAANYLSTAGAVKNFQVSEQSVDGFEDVTAYSTDYISDELLAELGITAEDLEVIWFDENSVLNGGTGAAASSGDIVLMDDSIQTPQLTTVLDGIRVFYPLGGDGDQYYKDTEKSAFYINVMSHLVKNGGVVTADSLFAYVFGDSANKTVSKADYEAIGSKDELYLAGDTNNALAFKISGGLNQDVNVMLSLRAANGAPSVTIGDKTITVTGQTEMFYDITEYVAQDGTVSIKNTGDGDSLLAICCLKITGGGNPAPVSELDLNSVAMMMFSPAPEVDEPTTGDEPTTEEPTTGDEPTTEEPTTGDEPTTEEPTIGDEPTAEEPTTGDEPTTEEPTTEEPTTGDEPTTEEPTTEEPTTEEPTTEEPTTEEPTTGENDGGANDDASFCDRLWQFIVRLVKFFAGILDGFFGTIVN